MESIPSAPNRARPSPAEIVMSKKTHFDHRMFLVEPGKPIQLRDHDAGDTGRFKDKSQAQDALQDDVARLTRAQELIWASTSHSVILIFQAMDAAGKDGTIKHVMSGVNPQGVDVHSFKAPSAEEVLRHYLWRPMRLLPPRGRIAIFNRSYYEEVLVVRVHPSFLGRQGITLPRGKKEQKTFWQGRYEEINAFEHTLARNRVLILKFFLNVSKAEQKKRFLARLDNPDKHWKFSAADLRERGFWDQYQHAYEEMLRATSTRHAPWYVIPANRKWFTRAAVADIIVRQLESLNLQFPSVSAEQLRELQQARQSLENET
jgi:PPK2 family polyphosphate:nucleotide phosphotransferase